MVCTINIVHVAYGMSQSKSLSPTKQIGSHLPTWPMLGNIFYPSLDYNRL